MFGVSTFSQVPKRWSQDLGLCKGLGMGSGYGASTYFDWRIAKERRILAMKVFR